MNEYLRFRYICLCHSTPLARWKVHGQSSHGPRRTFYRCTFLQNNLIKNFTSVAFRRHDKHCPDARVPFVPNVHSFILKPAFSFGRVAAAATYTSLEKITVFFRRVTPDSSFTSKSRQASQVEDVVRSPEPGPAS